MKILTLIIKQKYFDLIASGEKKEEVREIRYGSRQSKKYQTYSDEDGYQPIQYDALRLYVGYQKHRDTMLIEVKNSMFEYYQDEDGNYESYVADDGTECVYVSMVYELGEILEIETRASRST